MSLAFKLKTRKRSVLKLKKQSCGIIQMLKHKFSFSESVYLLSPFFASGSKSTKMDSSTHVVLYKMLEVTLDKNGKFKIYNVV
mmetsp:Transcript_16402/g.24178  ORF Transcript_16402/g.24178 Transcript_16402/m.24178 type:complete len:83 (+) Transcript_16402:1537-1785(+)